MDKEQTSNEEQTPVITEETPHADGKTTANNRTLMGILCYLGILWLVPYLMEKHDPFVKYHLKQGAVLLVVEVAVYAVSMMGFFYTIWMIVPLVNLGVLALAIVGIVNVVQEKEAELPLVGQFGSKFNI